MQLLLQLAALTGRHVGPHISMLLASLEGAGLLPTEAEAQVWPQAAGPSPGGHTSQPAGWRSPCAVLAWGGPAIVALGSWLLPLLLVVLVTLPC